MNTEKKILTVPGAEAAPETERESESKSKTESEETNMKQERTELRERRTRNTKTFENRDHSMTTEIYFDPVHYQDEDGSWTDMDDSLTEETVTTEDTAAEHAGTAKDALTADTAAGSAASVTTAPGFLNKKGSWQVRFARHADAHAAVTLAKDTHRISWRLENAADTEAVADGEHKLRYPEILPGMDAQYRAFGESVKENIILKDKEHVPEALSFLYHTENLTAVQEDGRVEFRDETGEEVFCFSAPLMQDAAGARSEALGIILERIPPDAEADQSGSAETAQSVSHTACRITLIPDSAWLCAADRQYPVVIDPVTTTSKKLADIEDSHVDNLNFGTTYETSILLKTKGGDNIQRSFLKFTLPTLKTGDMIVNARLVLVSLAETGTSRSVEVHKVLQSWSAKTLTWNNRPLYDDTVEDIIKYTGDKQKYITLDITNLVKNWYINGGNYGLMIKDPHELSGYTEFLSSDCHDGYQDMRPHIDITYMNYSGLEDYWTYHTQSAGRAGDIHVNDYNGNLILVHDTLSMGGSLMPVNLSHVYNTNDCSEDIGYGYGFRLNYHQRLVKKAISGTDYYQHTDADGTQCYFYYDSEKKLWKDETGKDLTLIVNGETSAEPFVIKDKENNQLVFNKNGYLIQMKDNNGNKLAITYSGKRISKLTDGAGRVTTLTYDKDANGNANHLLSVKSPSGQVKSFTYTDGKLTAITDVDGEKVTYAYNSRKMLTSAKNIDGYELRYSYSPKSPYRVSGIAEYADGAAGNSLALTYGYNSTKYKDNKGRAEIYRFNNNGNLIHIHDGFGHAASGKYNRSGNHVNCLENETKLQSNVVQLLKDPMIQAKTCGWKSSVPGASQVTCTINTNASYAKLGTRSLCITGADTAGSGSWYQDVKVKKGNTYTFSAYVRADITSVGSGGYACIRLKGMDKEGSPVWKESWHLEQSTSGFVRLAVTYELPADSTSDTLRAIVYLNKVKGSLYADLAQLEPGGTPGRCSLVDNGDFHLGTISGYAGAGTTPEDMLTTAGTAQYRAAQCGITVTAASASLYQKPDTASTAVATLSKGTHLSSMNLYRDSAKTMWYHAKTSGGQTGYLKQDAAAPYAAGGAGFEEGVVAVSGAVLRSTYSDTGTVVLYSLAQGTRLAMRSSVKTDANGKKWRYAAVCYGNSIRYAGYIPEESVMHLARNAAEGRLTMDQRLYQEPSSQATVLSTLKKDSAQVLRGIVLKKDGTKWYGISAGQTFGYIPVAHLSITEDVLYDGLSTEKFTEKVGGLDTHIYKFQGDPEKDKKLTKTLDLAGKKGDTYMVNAWGRGHALPETDNDKSRRFGVEVVFVGASGNDTHYTNFSPDILDWQFLSDVYVAKEDYTSIRISYTYCHNANLAFFDGLSLFREEYGQTYVYDKDNNVVSVTDAQKQTQKFEYSSSQDLTGMTDARGNKFTYEYDSSHNVTKGTSAEGMVYKLSYDEKGNVVKSGAASKADETDGTWMSRTFTADKNHVSSVKDARGCTTYYSWNTEKDLVVSVADANKNQVWYAYDTLGRLTDAAQMVTLGGTEQEVRAKYGYTKDRLTSVTHNGFQYGFAYDGFGNTKSVSVAGSALASYEYAEKNGNLTKLTYGNGDFIRYVYDTQDRPVTEYCYSAASKTEQKLRSYVYDTEGNLYRVTDHIAGKTYTLSYDFLGRLMRVEDEKGCASQYTYDANNNMTRLRYETAGEHTGIRYAYDKDSRESETKIVASAGTVSRATAYDAWGRVSAQDWKKDSAAIFHVGYEYPDSGKNRVGLPKAIVNGTNRTEYAYDNNGNITSITAGGKTNTYVYDGLNQLVRENNAVLNKTITYRYDVGGNLVEEKEYAYTTGTLPATAVKTTAGTFDGKWKDQLLTWGGTAMTYDACGNMTKKGSTTYTWTQGRKLTGVNNGKSIQYYYDHTGARVKKVVAGTTTEYRMAGTLITSEKTGSDTMWYYYDTASNLFAVEISGARYYCLRNAQNDIIGLIDSSGKQVVEYQYDSWGNTVSITGSLASTVGQKNPFRYRGYYLDAETGMYYLRSRYYDPGIRRFINADKSSLVIKSHMSLNDKNLYAYCDGNPVARRDCSGNFWETVIDIVSLCVSTVELISDPTNPGAWIGFIGDAIDLIPFVTGVGETTRAVRSGLKTADKITIAKAVDFSDDAIDAMKQLDRSRGFTKSTPKLGQRIHEGYKPYPKFPKKGKEYREIAGVRPDYVDMKTMTVYELKPMNPRGVYNGIRQLKRYRNAMGNKYSYRLELY